MQKILFKPLHKIKTITICFLSIFITSNAANAQLSIEVTKGMAEPLPVAIPNLYGDQVNEQVMGQRISTLVMDDLQNSGLFKVIDQSAFLQSAHDLMKDTPRFEDWRLLQAQGLISGSVKQLTNEGSQKYEISFKLWDVFAQEQLAGYSYEIFENDWRRAAHKISDVIYNRLTGEEGYFDSRIVYIAEQRTEQGRTKRLAIMDQDGANHKFITDSRYLVLTPRFSPNSQKITYMAYYNDKPRVYILDLQTGFREMVGEFNGMTFAPRFSPDGSHILMSFSQNGSSDIYEMNLKSKKLKRLTNTQYISTSASYSPDGKQIVFESDRGGSQQLYVMDRNGSNVKRISFGRGSFASPVWSPRGDLIAFTKMADRKFHIGVVRPDGKGERILVQDYHVEGPTWAPNGRTLMFFREEPSKFGGRVPKTAKLYQIDLTGFFERKVRTPLDASDPAWSPLLK
jgi:TolB protein